MMHAASHRVDDRSIGEPTLRMQGAQSMNEQSSGPAAPGDFNDVVLPHLHSAYNLARWLVRNTDDAQDIVQEASLRAFRHFDGFRGGDARAWLLTIVRNTCYRWQRKNRPKQPVGAFDERVRVHADDHDDSTPETLMLQSADRTLVGQAINELPVRFREVLVLRELEGLTYKEIADAMGVPIGTVMSSLSRARGRFRRAVGDLLTRNAWESESTPDPCPLD